MKPSKYPRRGILEKVLSFTYHRKKWGVKKTHLFHKAPVDFINPHNNSIIFKNFR